MKLQCRSTYVPVTQSNMLMLSSSDVVTALSPDGEKAIALIRFLGCECGEEGGEEEEARGERDVLSQAMK